MKNSIERAECKPKPFPWFCLECGKEEVRLTTVHDYLSQLKYNGKLYNIAVAEFLVPKCSSCGELVFTNDAEAQISRTFRQQEGLLQPEEIEQNLQDRKVNQRELADALGVAEVTVSRWKTGAVIQSRAGDKAMREFFKRTPLWGSGAATSEETRVGQKVGDWISDIYNALRSSNRDDFIDWLCAHRQDCLKFLQLLAEQYFAGKQHVLHDLIPSLEREPCVSHIGETTVDPTVARVEPVTQDFRGPRSSR